MELNEALEHLEELLEEADLAASEQGRVAALGRAERVAADAVRRWPEAADLHHALGLVRYARGADARSEALRAFDNALRSDPGHQFARLYRAYVNYEDGDYRAALADAEQVDPGFFDLRDVHWRTVSVLEVQVAALLRIGQLSTARRLMPGLVAEYTPERVTEHGLAFPGALVQAVVTCTDGTPAWYASAFAQPLLDLIEQNGWAALVGGHARRLRSIAGR